MQLQAQDLSLSSFHEFLPIPLPPAPSSHWALWSQCVTAFRPVLHHRPLTPCKVHLIAGPQLLPMSTLHPPLCCASTHLCSHTLSQMVGPIQLEACLSVKGRGLCPSQAGLTAQLTVQCAWGACTCTLAPATCPSNKWVQVPSKPEQQDSSLHYCKLLACITREQSQPCKIYFCKPQHKGWMLWRERFSWRKALFKVIASVLAGEERKI